MAEDLVIVNLIGDYPGWRPFIELFELGMRDVVGVENAIKVLNLSTILRPDYSVPSYRPLRSRGISVKWPEDHAPKTEQAKAGIFGLEASYTPQN